MSVEVFKTTVQEPFQAIVLITQLIKSFPDLKINFDLDDCDKILRVEGTSISIDKIIYLVTDSNFLRERLE